MSVQTSNRLTMQTGVRRWLMHHLVNPLMEALLRSPLHALASGSVVLLSYEGQQTGHNVTLPVQYARDRAELYVVAGNAGAKTWWRNMRGGCGVRLWLRGRKAVGRADIVRDVRDAVRVLSVYLGRFPAMAKRWGIRREANGAFVAEDVLRAAKGLLLVRIDLNFLVH